MRFEYVFAACLLGFLAPLRASTITVSGDTYISPASPSENFGNATTLLVGDGDITLLQFDVSSLAGVSPLTQVDLEVWVTGVTDGEMIGVSQVTSAWSESTVTYNASPTLGPIVYTGTADSAGEYFTIDVTSLVQTWLAVPSSNYGFALEGMGGAVVSFASLEDTSALHPAELVTPQPVPEPAQTLPTAAALAALALGFRARRRRA
jgi:hypothetical protein